MRLKDVEPIIRELQDEEQYGADYYLPIELLKSAPTIEAKPIVHAHWEKWGCEGTVCSNCYGRVLYECDEQEKKSEFCPHCGAQMDEKPNYEHPRKSVKIPVLYISDIPSALEEIEARKRNEKAKDELI